MKGTSGSKLDSKWGRFTTLEVQEEKDKGKRITQNVSVIFISFTLWEKKKGKLKSPKKGKEVHGSQERQINSRKPTVKSSAIMKAL